MHYVGANLGENLVKIGDNLIGYWPQRKSSFVSGSRCLCKISSKSVKNCDRESADRQTDRQTDTHKNKQTEMTGVIL